MKKLLTPSEVKTEVKTEVKNQKNFNYSLFQYYTNQATPSKEQLEKISTYKLPSKKYYGLL